MVTGTVERGKTLDVVQLHLCNANTAFMCHKCRKLGKQDFNANRYKTGRNTVLEITYQYCTVGEKHCVLRCIIKIACKITLPFY